MKLMLAGETTAGGLAGSLQSGLAEYCELVVFDPYGATSEAIDDRSFPARLRRKLARRHAGDRILAAVEMHQPDWVLVIKGRGLDSGINLVRGAGAKVACYYPDNPYWRVGDPGARERLAHCDLSFVWSQRIADRLASEGVATRVVPFGYDARWFPLTEPQRERQGIVFLGSWSSRRERYLSALVGLPVTVCGSGWEASKTVVAKPAIYEQQAGELLAQAAIGVNLLHPQCAGAHNMRTREIAATGALQLCDPGTDGTPLTDGAECMWFDSPESLRSIAVTMLADPTTRYGIAKMAQTKTAEDHYGRRAFEVVQSLEAAA